MTVQDYAHPEQASREALAVMERRERERAVEEARKLRWRRPRHYMEVAGFWGTVTTLFVFWSIPDNSGAVTSDEVGALIFGAAFALGGLVADVGTALDRYREERRRREGEIAARFEGYRQSAAVADLLDAEEHGTGSRS